MSGLSNIQLKEKIKQYILELYNAEYTGYLEVEKNDTGYKMSIGIPHYMFPTTVACDFDTDEEFLDYIYEDFKIRNYMRVYFYKVIRTPESREQ